MTKRHVAITLASFAGYHNDTARYTRLMIESRVSRKVLAEAWAAGVAKRASGVVCKCFECSR